MMKILDRAEVTLEEILRRDDTQASEAVERPSQTSLKR